VIKIKNLKNARHRDLEFIEKLCTDTWEPLYRFIYFKVQNREEAEDITQETYVKALSYLQRHKSNINTPISFLKVVALNILRDKWRNKRKHQRIKVDFELINLREIASEDSTEISADRMLIEKALQQLNDEQRTVVKLRILKGYSVAETAKIINKKKVLFV